MSLDEAPSVLALCVVVEVPQGPPRKVRQPLLARVEAVIAAQRQARESLGVSEGEDEVVGGAA